MCGALAVRPPVGVIHPAQTAKLPSTRFFMPFTSESDRSSGISFPGRSYARIAWREIRRAPPQQVDDLVLRASDVPIDGPRLALYRRLSRDASRVPLTWPHVLSTPLQTALAATPAFPVSPMGLVHVEQRIERLAAVSLDDRVDLEVRLDSIEPTERGPRLTISTEMSVRERLVWRGTSVALHRPTRRNGRRPASENQERRIADVRAERRFGSGAGRRYSSVSWDLNPIHLGRLLALPFGFPRAILHGMATVGWALGRLAPREDAPATLECRFRKPLLLPGNATLSAWYGDNATEWVVTGGEATHVTGTLTQ